MSMRDYFLSNAMLMVLAWLLSMSPNMSLPFVLPFAG